MRHVPPDDFHFFCNVGDIHLLTLIRHIMGSEIWETWKISEKLHKECEQVVETREMSYITISLEVLTNQANCKSTTVEKCICSSQGLEKPYKRMVLLKMQTMTKVRLEILKFRWKFNLKTRENISPDISKHEITAKRVGGSMSRFTDSDTNTKRNSEATAQRISEDRWGTPLLFNKLTCFLLTQQKPLPDYPMAPHSSALAWKIPWTEEPGGLQSMGSRRVGHDSATSLSLFTFTLLRRKWQPTPSFFPGESQGRGSLVGCRLWGRTESDTTEVT